MADSNTKIASKITNTRPLKVVTVKYLSTCRDEFMAWVFEQAAKGSFYVLLLLFGLISDATNWF